MNFIIFLFLVVYNERTGVIDVKIKKNINANGREQISIKTSRYNKSCVDFFRKLDGTKTKLWHFKPEQKDELKAFFAKDKTSFTIC